MNRFGAWSVTAKYSYPRARAAATISAERADAVGQVRVGMQVAADVADLHEDR